MSDYKKITDLLIDRTVLDLIAMDYIKKPERLTYDMLDDTEFLEEEEEDA